MSERLEALRFAIQELFYDDHVTWNADNTYQVQRPGGSEFLVMQHEGGDWCVYHSGSTPDHRMPAQGIAGTNSSSPEYAIAWVLADPWYTSGRS